MSDNKDAFTTNPYFERSAFLHINLILPLRTNKSNESGSNYDIYLITVIKTEYQRTSIKQKKLKNKNSGNLDILAIKFLY